MKIAASILIPLLALAAGGCATTPEPAMPEIEDSDPVIAQLSSVARKAFEAGEYPGAVVMYRRALERARAMDNSGEIARNAYNLAAGLIALGDSGEAVRLLSEAEREALRAGDDAGPALLLQAQILREQGDGKAALAVIDRLERLAVSGALPAQAYVLRAEIACDRGDVASASAYLGRARGILRRQPDNGLAASIARVSGRIGELEQQWGEAGASYDREAAWLQRAGRPAEMADALERAGRCHLQAGSPQAASDRYYRAARSMMAQGSYLRALHVIEQAVEIGGDHEESPDAQAIAALFEEIRQSVENKSRAGTRP